MWKVTNLEITNMCGYIGKHKISNPMSRPDIDSTFANIVIFSLYGKHFKSYGSPFNLKYKIFQTIIDVDFNDSIYRIQRNGTQYTKIVDGKSKLYRKISIKYTNVSNSEVTDQMTIEQIIGTYDQFIDNYIVQIYTKKDIIEIDLNLGKIPNNPADSEEVDQIKKQIRLLDLQIEKLNHVDFLKKLQEVELTKVSSDMIKAELDRIHPNTSSLKQSHLDRGKLQVQFYYLNKKLEHQKSIDERISSIIEMAKDIDPITNRRVENRCQFSDSTLKIDLNGSKEQQFLQQLYMKVSFVLTSRQNRPNFVFIDVIDDDALEVDWPEWPEDCGLDLDLINVIN